MLRKFLLTFVLFVFISGCAQGPSAPPAPPELVSCIDSLDCPAQMMCKESKCIDMGCIKAGDTGPSAGINPEWLDHLPSECCPGLKEISSKAYFNEACERVPIFGAPSFVCSDCGNNVCEEWEVKCNCPEDC